MLVRHSKTLRSGLDKSFEREQFNNLAPGLLDSVP